MKRSVVVARGLCKLRGWHIDTTDTWYSYDGYVCQDCGTTLPHPITSWDASKIGVIKWPA